MHTYLKREILHTYLYKKLNLLRYINIFLLSCVGKNKFYFVLIKNYKNPTCEAKQTCIKKRIFKWYSLTKPNICFLKLTAQRNIFT